MQSGVNESAISELKAVVGDGAWIVDPHETEPYTRDWRALWPGTTPIVLLPHSAEEVSAIIKTCTHHNLAVVPQSGNTGLVGGGTPDSSGNSVVVSLNRMNTIRSIDVVGNTMTAEAGCILADVQEHAREHNRLYPLSLAAEGSCRIGGVLSTNAGGTNVLKYGSAREHVLGLEVVLADGRIWNGLRHLRKDNTGYDLKQVFLGSEGTLGIITAAVLKLWPLPEQTVTSWIGLSDVNRALALLTRLQDETGGQVTAFEYIEKEALDCTFRHFPEIRSPLAGTHPVSLLVEVSSGTSGGTLRNTVEDTLMTHMSCGTLDDAVIAESVSQQRAFWHIRDTIPEAQIHQGGGIKHDIAVPLPSIAKFLQIAPRKVREHFPDAVFFVFGHLGDGNIHFNICACTAEETTALLARQTDINNAVEGLAVDLGGSFSAEHGVGRLRLPQMDLYKPALERELMATLKDALDPKGILNPGKVVRAGTTDPVVSPCRAREPASPPDGA